MPAKQRLYRILEVAEADDRASRWFDIGIFSLIVANVAAVILETVASIRDLRRARVLRLLRLLRAAKLGRYSRSLQTLGRVLVGRRGELAGTTALMGVLLILASSALYFAERAAQPDDFSSIPAAIWWAIATLTTVGYGDVTPITPLGRVLAAFVAIFGSADAAPGDVPIPPVVKMIR